MLLVQNFMFQAKEKGSRMGGKDRKRGIGRERLSPKL